MFVNQYLIIKDLGRGAHGTVKLALDTEDQIVYAMKVCMYTLGSAAGVIAAEQCQVCKLRCVRSTTIYMVQLCSNEADTKASTARQ